ncbi:SMP-30/gluconolactonase/LRE family protein [Pseudonocardia xinjiangensis]|uniref:Sugar lactone lactonase YvrE n=1 Tax=Pseudonocardia xinjiangensis TaxID=75289 RepID=A0ABX1RG34_9PSEU|nr:hypothetical protein [Pseudonocardia xinjiangensis]NMH78599.1 hypothetical protein [Pseudonocardia xinjiangensis]
MSNVSLHDQLNHEPVPFDAAPAETIAEWEPGTFVENLAPHPDGGWLVTVPSHHRIDHVTVDGRHNTFAQLAAMPTGIVTAGDETWVVSGFMGEPGWRLDRVRRGRVEHVCELPLLRFGNGMARAGRRLLIADSALGIVLAVDLDSARAAPWLEHELLTPPAGAAGIPGVNGIVVTSGHVLLTNTARALVLRIPVAATDSAGLEVLAERLVADDLAADGDGTLYLATHLFDTVLRLDPDGRRTDIAGPSQGVETSTSVAIDAGDPDVLWVTAAGERFGGGHVKPARLIRLMVSHPSPSTST